MSLRIFADKTILDLDSDKNNGTALPARTLGILLRFFAVLALTAAQNDQICGCAENVSTRRHIFNFL